MGKPAWVERAHRARGVSSPAEPEDAAEVELEGHDRATCPDCGRDVAVNKDGSLRKHACVGELPDEE